MASWRRRLGLAVLVVMTFVLAGFALFVILENTRPLEPERLRTPGFSGLLAPQMKDRAR